MSSVNEVKISTKTEQLYFYKIKDGIYRADISDIRRIELPVIYICSVFRNNNNDIPNPFKKSEEVYITLKYVPGSYFGSVIVSTSISKSIISYQNNNLFSIGESDASKLINESEDADDSVNVELILVYHETGIKCVFGSIPTNGWVNKALSFLDKSKKIFGWFLLTLLTQFIVALMGYWVKGEPLYIISLLKNTFNYLNGGNEEMGNDNLSDDL